MLSMIKNLFKGDDNMVDLDKVIKVKKLMDDGATLSGLETQGILGTNRRSFMRTANALGYIHNRELKTLVKDDSIEVKPQVIKPRSNKPSTIATKATKQDTNNQGTTIEALEQRIIAIEELLVNRPQVIDGEVLELDSRVEGKILTRSVRASDDAFKLFNEIAENKLAKHSKHQLLSQAIIEFCEKYK